MGAWYKKMATPKWCGWSPPVLVLLAFGNCVIPFNTFFGNGKRGGIHLPHRSLFFVSRMPSLSAVVLFVFLQFFSSLVSCGPLPVGVSYQKPSSLPILTLPYGSYRAATYRAASDM